MATFGIYQVLDPLYVTAHGSVNSAKIVGGEAEGRIAVKIFNATPADPDEPNWEPKYFLDRAQVQRRVAAAGGAHWAPIYALGFTHDNGAYYVTDYHALTAQKMIDGRVPLDARALHAIIHSVLAGLEEIRRVAGRAHANLKPANVLLVGKGPADELRAVLSDPGQEYKAQKDGEGGDLHDVGRLIHELVLCRPPTNGEVPDTADPAWSKLGDKADAWRQLCSDLLSHPITPRVATIAGAMKVVDALAPSRLRVPHLRLHSKPKPGNGAANGGGPRQVKRRPKTPRPPSKLKRRIVQLVAVLILVGGTLGVLSMLEASAREELCKARDGWYGSLALALSEPARRERFEADPHLRRVADGVAAIEQSGVQCAGGRPQALGFLDFLKTRKAVAALHQVEQDLAPESWPQLTAIRELAKTYDKRGWQQPAGFVQQLLEGVRPTPTASTAMSRPSVAKSDDAPPPPAASPGPGSLAQRVERVLRLRPVIEQQSKDADADWQQLDERAAALEASPDPIVHGFGALLRRDAIAAVKLTDEGFAGLPQLKQNAGLAKQVIDEIHNGPPGQVDTVRFAEEVVRTMNPRELEPKDLRHWLSQRPLYVVRKTDIAAATGRLQRLYDTTRDEVVKSAPEQSEAPAFEQEQKDVEGALKDFSHTPFIERDVTEGKFALRVSQIEGQIGGLKRYYHAEDAEDWLANLAPFAATSARLKSRWDAWVTTLRADARSMVDDRELFNANKSRTDALRDVLTSLEIALPQPPDGLTDDFAKAARAKREDQLDGLLKLIDTAEPAIKPEAVKESADVLAAWFVDLKQLNQDFPVRKRLLTLEDRPDARWKKNEAFWNDATVQGLVRADVDRIDRLQKLRSAPREKLVSESAAEAVRPEVVVAAWQLLGGDAVTPPWPNTTPELLTEAALRGKVAAEVQSFDMAAPERDVLETLLAREGPRRWRRFVENATSEPMLVAALERQIPFRVNADALANLSATARFNVWLCIANLAARDNNSKGLNDVVVKLRLAAEELRAEATLAKLDQLTVPDPFAGRDLGPTFTLGEQDVKGLSDPIEFRRVDRTEPGARPFYLATRELTFAQFVGAIDGAARWEEARKLAWPYRPGKGDARRGARVWEWTDPAAPRPGLTQLWMTPDEVNKHNDFPREFRPERSFNRNILRPEIGGMPTDRHPIQYVSAQAALFYAAQLGLRLPTSAEWRTALAASGKTAANGNWNLRDAPSWETFRKHATKENIAPEHWPDRGAFPGDPATGPVTTAPFRRGPADNALLFRGAPSNDGTFHDLIGNVAEFVCDVPDAFARHDKQTADDFKRFCQDTPDAVAVIGGSALSPPDVPLDEPQAVKRPDRAYSDVGLRLAFTAPARNLAERLKYVLAGEEYVWPRTAASLDTSPSTAQ